MTKFKRALTEIFGWEHDTLRADQSLIDIFNGKRATRAIYM